MDLKRIEALIEVIEDSQVAELSVRQDGSTVVVRKPVIRKPAAKPKAKPTAAKPAPKPQVEDVRPGETVVSAPMVGIFHHADGVDSPGSVVKKGQVIGIIESMKLMNEVPSDADGKVVEVCVEDGMPVEYGQALLKLTQA